MREKGMWAEKRRTIERVGQNVGLWEPYGEFAPLYGLATGV